MGYYDEIIKETLHDLEIGSMRNIQPVPDMPDYVKYRDNCYWYNVDDVEDFQKITGWHKELENDCGMTMRYDNDGRDEHDLLYPTVICVAVINDKEGVNGDFPIPMWIYDREGILEELEYNKQEIIKL